MKLVYQILLKSSPRSFTGWIRPWLNMQQRILKPKRNKIKRHCETRTASSEAKPIVQIRQYIVV